MQLHVFAFCTLPGVPASPLFSAKSHICLLGPPLRLSGPYPVRCRESQRPHDAFPCSFVPAVLPIFLSQWGHASLFLKHWWTRMGWTESTELGGHRHVTSGGSPAAASTRQSALQPPGPSGPHDPPPGSCLASELTPHPQAHPQHQLSALRGERF